MHLQLGRALKVGSGSSWMSGALPRPAQRTPSQPSRKLQFQERETEPPTRGQARGEQRTVLRPPGGEAFSPNVIRPESTDVGEPQQNSPARSPTQSPQEARPARAHGIPNGTLESWNCQTLEEGLLKREAPTKLSSLARERKSFHIRMW